MGRSFGSVGLALVCTMVGLIAALTGCSSSSPTRDTPFPAPAKIILSPSTDVSLEVGNANQIFTATPQNNKGTNDYDSGSLSFEQHIRTYRGHEWACLRGNVGLADCPPNLHSWPGRSGTDHGNVAWD